MGTWGCGNFDNDEAMDYVSELVEQFAELVDKILADEEGASNLDDAGEGQLMPTVEIITMLCEKAGVSPPGEERVQHWKEAYLVIFDAQIAAMEPVEDYEEERREVISATFDRLLALGDVEEFLENEGEEEE